MSIIIIILVFLITPFKVFAGYDHIKLAYAWFSPSPTSDEQTFLGNRYSILITDTAVTTPSLDWSTLLSTNSNMLIFGYISGNSFYKYYPSNSTTNPDWHDFYTDGSYTVENAFFHYDEDKTWGDIGERDTTVLYPGFTAGLNPGYDSGTGTAAAHTRAISAQWGSADSGSASISTVARASNVVTVGTSAAHGLYIGDRIQISGVDDSGFNGYFDVTAVDSTTQFKYTQSGSDTSSSNGTMSYSCWVSYAINYADTAWRDFTKDRIDERLKDASNNKLNGYFYDSILNMPIYQDRYELTKIKECKDLGATCTDDATVWVKTKIIDWLSNIKSSISTYLSGSGKTAYTCVNGDSFSYIYDHIEFYQNASSADIILDESSVGPNSNNPSSFEPDLKAIYDLMNTYNKKYIFQGKTYATIPPGSWTNHSGYIYYTDQFSTSKTAITAVDSLVVKTSLEAVIQNSFYWDSSAKRLYVWKNDNSNPSDGTSISIVGAEKHWLTQLAIFYTFFNHTNGYFFPWHSGYIYSAKPNTNTTWIDAIARNVGSPAYRGKDVDGSIGNDLWSGSLESSSKPYEMWRGDGETTYDNNSVLLDANHRIYARRYTNGYAIYRPRANYDAPNYAGTKPKTFTMPFYFQKLRSDNTLDSTTNQITLEQGEGAFLVSYPSSIATSSEGTQSFGLSAEGPHTLTLQ
jgi:hypothetical protein